MPDYSVGSASVKISPSFTDFAKKARAELKAMDLSTDVRLNVQAAQAESELEAFARQDHSTDLRVDLDSDKAATGLDLLSRARVAEIEARILGKEATQARLDEVAHARVAAIEAKMQGTTEVQAQLAELARTRTARIQALLDNSNAARAKGDFDKLVSGLRSAGTLSLKVTGVVGAAGVISQILAIGEAAAQAAHLVALIPAGGFAGLAGIGSVATGIHGIPAAFKAINSAGDNPTEQANKQRDALDAVSNAEYNATQADKKLGDAYRESTRQIRDMNDQLQDQKFAVEGAALSVEDAAKNLQKVNLNPLSDSTARKRALLDYQEAVQRQKEAGEKLADQAQDTATANAKGVAGSDQVVEAIHAQTVAQQELAKAQAAATASSGSGPKVNDALAKLSPNAKELVADLRAVGPAWHDAQQAGQDALTGGLGSSIQQLARADLPAAKDGIVGINTAINGGLRSSIALLTTQGAKNDFATSVNNVTGAFKNASGAAQPLTDAVLKLITVGSQDLPGLGTAVTNIANRFDSLIQRTAADGSLKRWIDDGVTSAKELAQTAEHVGSSIASVFRAAGDNGQTLRSLDDLTGRMATFLKSTQGQQDMRQFFQQAREDLDKFKPILQDLPGLLSGVYGGFRTWSGIALPFLKAAGDLLGAHPGLVRDIVTAYLAFKTVNPILSGLQSGWKNINDRLTSFKTGLSGAKAATEEVGATAAAQAGEKGVGKLGGALGGLGKVLSASGPLGIGAITTGIGLGLNYLADQHQKAADAAQAQKDKEDALQATLDKETGAVTAATTQSVAQDLQKNGFLTRAESFGIDPHTFVQATAGLAQSDKDRINQQLTKAITDDLSKSSFYKEQIGPLAAQNGLSETDIAQALQGIPAAVKKYTDNQGGLPDLGQLKNDLTDVGESAATLGGEMNAYGTDLATAAGKQRELSEALNGTFKLSDQGKASFDNLGVAVQSVPDAKTIVIKDTTPEVQQKLKDLGFTVETLPDGTIKLTAQTDVALADIQQVTNAPYVAKVKVEVDDSAYKPFTQSLSVNTLKALHGDTTPAAPGRADGGPVYGPGTDSSDSILMRLSTGEYVINADAVKKYGLPLMDAINNETYKPITPPAASSIPATTPAAPVAPTAVPSATPATTTSSTPAGVINPQVPLPTPMSDAQIEVSQDRAALDAANTERNAVYADPHSTPADRQAEDYKYRKAANQYGSALQQAGSGQGGAATLFSAQGAGQALGIGLGSVIGSAIGASVPGGQGRDFNAEFGGALGSKEGGELGQVLGQGILGIFGLDNSVLSSTNSWNSAFQKGIGASAGGIPNALGYGYQPQNLPSVPGSTAETSGSSAAAAAATSTASTIDPTTGKVINPDLGTIGTLSVSTPKTSYNSSAGVEQWRPLAAAILQREGFEPSEANVNTMLAQINTESGGNPNAINLWDSNAQAGHPSQGILQTIPSTFEAYRDPSFPDNINDPAANMAAALRYYRANYGSDLSTQWGHGHGYADGGLVRGPGGPKSDAVRALLSGGEYVINAHAAQRNLPLLEALNSSQWNPVGLQQMGSTTGTGGGAPVVNRDHSVNYHAPILVHNNDEFMRQQDRWVEQQSMGALAMYA